eukprot:1982362-Pleurochrysis_carterae.AAC.3
MANTFNRAIARFTCNVSRAFFIEVSSLPVGASVRLEVLDGAGAPRLVPLRLGNAAQGAEPSTIGKGACQIALNEHEIALDRAAALACPSQVLA